MYVSSGNSDRNICNTFVSVLFFVLTGTRPLYLVYTYPRGCNSETHRSSLGILALVVTLSDDAIRSICRICPRPSPPNLCSLVGPARLCARLAPQLHTCTSRLVLVHMSNFPSQFSRLLLGPLRTVVYVQLRGLPLYKYRHVRQLLLHCLYSQAPAIHLTTSLS